MVAENVGLERTLGVATPSLDWRAAAVRRYLEPGPHELDTLKGFTIITALFGDLKCWLS